ncbi:hypothetical protein [Amycolatopsis sp.]|nr:hypothetical protein [Amycolatopsis sp.]HET6711260.1 hypothetical protein [Amycolatopsis sp.]
MLDHEESLDLVFRALGDRTLVERLVCGPASVSEPSGRPVGDALK